MFYAYITYDFKGHLSARIVSSDPSRFARRADYLQVTVAKEETRDQLYWHHDVQLLVTKGKLPLVIGKWEFNLIEPGKWRGESETDIMEVETGAFFHDAWDALKLAVRNRAVPNGTTKETDQSTLPESKRV